MKKTAFVLALVLCLSVLTACGGSAQPTVTAPEGTAEELVNKVYENVTVELPLMSMPIDLADADTVAYMSGLTDASAVSEMVVSEPMMGSQAYSLVMVRLNDASQAETVAQTMFDNIDTRKWICVEATEKQAVVCGDVVMFIMLSPEYGVTTDQIVEAFTTVCGGTVGTIIK